MAVARDLSKKNVWRKAKRLADPEAARAADRARYARDKERIRERQKKYTDEHAEENRQRAAAWYEAHKNDPEVKRQRNEYNERWKIENREQYLAARKRRYERRMADPERAAKEKAAAAAGHRRRRDAFRLIANTAKAIGCRECGEREPVCLDFHHREPATKLFNIGKNLSRFSNAQVLRDEIAKCDVVCGNCHLRHHPSVRAVRDPSAKKYLNGVGDRARREERWGHAIARAKGAGCTLCAESDQRVLQFHHLDPALKVFQIGSYKQMPLKTDVWAEVQKCMVLCVNCHRRVHAGIAVLPDVPLETYWRDRLGL